MKRTKLKIAVGILTFVIGIFFTAFWCIYSPLNQIPQVLAPAKMETETTEEYAVYSAVINYLFVKDKDSVNFLTISNQTSFYESVGYLDNTTPEQRIQNIMENYPSVSEETILDYESKQTRPARLYPKFSLPVEYILIDSKQVEKSEGFAAKQIIRLSQVGFNKEKNQAFVYVEFFCPLCGHSNHILLGKESGVWKIKKDFSGWAS